MNPMASGGMVVALVLVLIALVSLVFQLVWNRTVPNVFGLKRITFWQSLGLLILASILTGSYRVMTTDITNSLKHLGVLGLVP
jgi:succinate dehydrogenase hydrophobic anchor subunit